MLDLHFHLHLDVVVDGRPVTVPDDVGRNADAGFIASLHTHDTGGIIHVESPAGLTYTLGQLFDVWGVRFTATCLGGDCNQDDRRVRVFADGTELRTRDPRLLILARHQEVVVTYGTPAQVPDPVPALPDDPGRSSDGNAQNSLARTASSPCQPCAGTRIRRFVTVGTLIGHDRV